MSKVEEMTKETINKLKQEYQERRNEDLQKFKKMHAELMFKKENEYKAILEDADKLIFEQEKEMESLNRKIKDLENDIW